MVGLRQGFVNSLCKNFPFHKTLLYKLFSAARDVLSCMFIINFPFVRLHRVTCFTRWAYGREREIIKPKALDNEEHIGKY